MKKPLLLFSILISILGFLFIFVTTSVNGPGVTPDSVNYFAGADGLSNGLGMVGVNGEPTATWPPVYPALIALMRFLTGGSVLSTAGFLNTILFAAVLFLSIHLLSLYTNSTLLLISYALLMIFSKPLLHISLYAWSELLFTVLVIISLLAVLYFSNQNKSSFLIAASLVSAAAVLTRYIGLSLIFACGLFILLFSNPSLRHRLIYVFLYGLLSLVPLTAWLIRNFILTETIAGPRPASTFTLVQNIKYTLGVAFGWFLPEPFSFPAVHILLVLAGAATAAVIFYQQGMLTKKTQKFILPLIFAGSYVAFLIGSETFSAMDKIDHRLLSPIYPIMAGVLVLLLGHLTRPLAARGSFGFWSRNIIWAAIIGGILVMSVKSAEGAAEARMVGQTGGYTSNLWKNHSFLPILKNHPNWLNGPVYSNNPPAVYFFLQVYASPLPRKYFYNSLEPVVELEALRYSWPEQNSTIVWFNSEKSSYYFLPAELSTVAHLNPLLNSDVGSVYKCNRLVDSP